MPGRTNAVWGTATRSPLRREAFFRFILANRRMDAKYSPVFLVSSDFVWEAALHLFGFCNKDKDLVSRLARGCKVRNPFVRHSLLSRSY